jgi:hypothetical protein
LKNMGCLPRCGAETLSRQWLWDGLLVS